MAQRNENGSDQSEPQTIDGETGVPDHTSRRIDLSTLRDVRLELTYLYQQIDACKITSQDGTRRAYVLRQIADVLTVAEIEPRLEQLEKRNGSNVAGGRAHQLATLASLTARFEKLEQQIE